MITAEAIPEPARACVDVYLAAVDEHRPGLVEALYLVGSVALDDFQPNVSDVDFIAVTSRPTTAEDRAALELVHAIVAEQRTPVFEGHYATLDELRSSPLSVASMLRYHDGSVQQGVASAPSPVDWCSLAAHGVPMRGLEPAAIGVWADVDVLKHWTRDNIDTYWRTWLERTGDPSSRTAEAMLTDWGIAWSVLGIARLHYTLTTGQITSKSGGGRHALEAFDARWRPIITEAIRCRPHPPMRPASVREAVKRRDHATAFLAEVVLSGAGAVRR